MLDREKVIEILESCVANPLHRKSDKFVISFDVRFANAIIELLKEQEAVEPIPYAMKWNPECDDCAPEGIDDCIECRKRMKER